VRSNAHATSRPRVEPAGAAGVVRSPERERRGRRAVAADGDARGPLGAARGAPSAVAARRERRALESDFTRY
jgi:hypothetical protein